MRRKDPTLPCSALLRIRSKVHHKVLTPDDNILQIFDYNLRSFQGKAQTKQNRRESEVYTDLSGTWDFHYFDNVRLIENEYWLASQAAELDYDQIIDTVFKTKLQTGKLDLSYLTLEELNTMKTIFKDELRHKHNF